jgi:hypothetical protein
MIAASRMDLYRPGQWLVPAAFLLAAFVSRLLTAIWFPSIHHPDEIYQSLEQAHRAVFGYGLVPWEFRDGARSWLLAGMLAMPMWIGEHLAPSTSAYRQAVLAMVAAISASIPAFGYWWGRRFGPVHGLMAGVALLVWFELLYYGAKGLSEVVAGAFLFAGVLLCTDRSASASTRKVAVAGACLGMAFVFRFHLAPAIAVAAVWLARGDWRAKWLPLIAGGAVPLALLGTVDWLTWSVPFGSIIENFRANIVEGRSHIYGTSPWYWYAAQWLSRWGAAAPLLGALAVVGARRQPLPLLVALVIVAAHSTVAHKEYRFLYPAIALLVASAAIGAAEICRLATEWRGRAWGQVAIPLLLSAAWVLGSYAMAISAPNAVEWSRGRAGLELMQRAGHEARCGVALLGAGWDMTGGYSSLHRDIPLHLLYPANRTEWNPASFDVWIAPAGWLERLPLAAAFVPRSCVVQNAQGFKYLCYWIRQGGCRRHPTTEANHVMPKYGF